MTEFAYLIVVSHRIDEFPLRLEFDRDEAFDYAESVPWEIPDALARLLELPEAKHAPCIVSIITYRNGDPVSRVIVRDFDDEGDDGDEAVEPVTDPSASKGA